jgi:hypothetical protein
LNAVRRLGQVRRSHRARPGASGDKIGRADFGGANVNTAFVTGASGPRGIVADGTYLYWANHTSNTVGRSLLNGTGVSQSFVVSASSAAADLLRPAGLNHPGSRGGISSRERVGYGFRKKVSAGVEGSSDQAGW